MPTLRLSFPAGLLLAALALPLPVRGQDAARLILDPPLDPIAGTFAAVAYSPEPDVPLTSATFRLLDPDGVETWAEDAPFSLDWRRAVARCDTSGLPDGEYSLVVTSGDHAASSALRLEQGRELLPDERPFRSRMLWMPMTGCSDEDLDDAAAAGYDTLFTKAGIWHAGPGRPLDFSYTDGLIRKARARGMKVLIAWLLWTGLPEEGFDLECFDGSLLRRRIDPCDEAAMAHVRRHAELLLDHYMGCRDVIAIAPTWGIYGEAGYPSTQGGYSRLALMQFNRWLAERGETPVATLPPPSAPIQDVYPTLLFHRFRFEYVSSVWSELNAHLRRLEPNGIAIGAWQEIYNAHNYQLALSECLGADFAINEMCFPFVTTYDQKRAIGETMGIRYKCSDFKDYRRYYLPLMARRWAEGQQAIGCQLTSDYAEKNYSAWPPGRAEELGFQQWEDRFAPDIRRVRDTEVFDEPADVAFVQMTYPVTCYPDLGGGVTDINLFEIVLRQLGVAYDRLPITTLSRISRNSLARYKCIIVPDAWYLDEEMWLKLTTCGADILLTGGVMQVSDGGRIPNGGERHLDGVMLRYGPTDGGQIAAIPGCPPNLLRDIEAFIGTEAGVLPPDVGLSGIEGADTFLTVGEQPLLARTGRLWFLTNRLLYACAYDPEREPPQLGGSRDVSANEGDPWGLASSASPRNRFGEMLVRNILRASGVLARIPDPPSRGYSPFIGDHAEAVSITGNIVANQQAESQTIEILCRRPVTNFPCTPTPGRDLWKIAVTVPAYDFVALEYGNEE